MKLKNKVAIVTGGGKGIGEEICLGLVKEGAKIVIADLDKKIVACPIHEYWIDVGRPETLEEANMSWDK